MFVRGTQVLGVGCSRPGDRFANPEYGYGITTRLMYQYNQGIIIEDTISNVVDIPPNLITGESKEELLHSASRRPFRSRYLIVPN
jgi:hypothetical protein